MAPVTSTSGIGAQRLKLVQMTSASAERVMRLWSVDEADYSSRKEGQIIAFNNGYHRRG